MNVAVGTDHAGFALRDTVFEAIRRAGHTVVDCGARVHDAADDYPDFAKAVAEAIIAGRAERGVLLCGSGVGIAVAANKFPGVRASPCHDTFSARQGVEDDAMNALCLGARVVGPALAGEIVVTFLAATFSNAERHRRRLQKVISFEQRQTG